METEQESAGSKPPRIRRGRVDSLSLYEITDHELDILERGSPASLYLNFGLVLLSTSASFLVALLTSSMESTRTFIVFVVVVVLGFIVGGILMSLWWTTRKAAGTVVAQIQSRMPAEETAKPPEGGG